MKNTVLREIVINKCNNNNNNNNNNKISLMKNNLTVKRQNTYENSNVTEPFL